jgi:hypothetical protein
VEHRGGREATAEVNAHYPLLGYAHEHASKPEQKKNYLKSTVGLLN